MIAFYAGRVSGLAALPDILQIVGINSDLPTAALQEAASHAASLSVRKYAANF
jgi:hypothetical protein